MVQRKPLKQRYGVSVGDKIWLCPGDIMATVASLTRDGDIWVGLEGGMQQRVCPSEVRRAVPTIFKEALSSKDEVYITDGKYKNCKARVLKHSKKLVQVEITHSLNPALNNSRPYLQHGRLSLLTKLDGMEYHDKEDKGMEEPEVNSPLYAAVTETATLGPLLCAIGSVLREHGVDLNSRETHVQLIDLMR